MHRLNPNNDLFINLEMQNPLWWQTLVADKDIYIEIRKENYIDVYFNGGNIISELKCGWSGFIGKIHYKYLLPEKAEYIKYDFSGCNNTMMKKSHIDFMNIDSFNSDTLKRIKANISHHYPGDSEKGIQAKFIKNGKHFIDSEFAYNYMNGLLRIDLIWVDLEAEKIIPVELKTMGDKRLYTNEISMQLQKYKDFMKNNGSKILDYYKRLFLIKKKLKILPHGLDKLTSLNNFTIEERPLLLFGDCVQKWIDDCHDDIDNKIRSIAYGTYYYGNTKSSCRLRQPKHKNRQIY